MITVIIHLNSVIPGTATTATIKYENGQPPKFSPTVDITMEQLKELAPAIASYILQKVVSGNIGCYSWQID